MKIKFFSSHFFETVKVEEFFVRGGIFFRLIFYVKLEANIKSIMIHEFHGGVVRTLEHEAMH